MPLKSEEDRGWVLECENCGSERMLYVGYDISDFEKIYIFCSKCGRNTMHRIIGYKDGELSPLE
ncbi:MAG: hypothetical protein DRJ49_01275 [Thermoprotei archaeon]|nr:MAG: hypothetical protein DRJ49_01275 [Thermoprotei archaeon]